MLKHEPHPALADGPIAHRLAIEEDLTPVRVGKLQPRDQAQQRRLARAGRTEQREQLARFYLQADAVQRREATEGFSDLPNFDAHRDQGL